LHDRRLINGAKRADGVFRKETEARILAEASTESEWVARCLEASGHEVIVGDANYAPMYSQWSDRVKTDQRDVEALAHACRPGAYRPAHRTSDRQRHVRGLLGVREALVRTRARWIALIQPLLRRDGIRVRSGWSMSFVTRVEELACPRISGRGGQAAHDGAGCGVRSRLELCGDAGWGGSVSGGRTRRKAFPAILRLRDRSYRKPIE
jgi:hypothetical protein